MSSGARIQHYVPQFYLRQFALKKGKSYLINCFDKTTQSKFVTNVDRIGCEAYFFDGQGTDQTTEQWLARIDNRFSKVYHRILKHHDLRQLSRSERISLAHFVALQWIRTREYREYLRDWLNQLKLRFESERLSERFERRIRLMTTDEFIVSLQIDVLRRAVPELAGIIRQMKWILLSNDTDLPFWTSDHPLTRYNPLKPRYKFMGNLGLKSLGIQVLFPLSPSLSLQICDPVSYPQYSSKMEARRENVVFHNEMQVEWSTRHIFSISDDFQIAIDRIRKYPELGQITRRRVDVH